MAVGSEVLGFAVGLAVGVTVGLAVVSEVAGLAVTVGSEVAGLAVGFMLGFAVGFTDSCGRRRRVGSGVLILDAGDPRAPAFCDRLPCALTLARAHTRRVCAEREGNLLFHSSFFPSFSRARTGPRSPRCNRAVTAAVANRAAPGERWKLEQPRRAAHRGRLDDPLQAQASGSPRTPRPGRPDQR